MSIQTICVVLLNTTRRNISHDEMISHSIFSYWISRKCTLKSIESLKYQINCFENGHFICIRDSNVEKLICRSENNIVRSNWWILSIVVNKRTFITRTYSIQTKYLGRNNNPYVYVTKKPCPLFTGRLESPRIAVALFIKRKILWPKDALLFIIEATLVLNLNKENLF